MNTLLDNLLVGAAILLSAVYAVAKLGPRSLRTRMLAALSRRLAAAPSFPGLRRLSKSLATAAGKEGACGGCDNCGTETSAAPQSSSVQSSAATKQPSAEITVPVASIGRRA